jgi:hypothetical protein
MSRVTLFGEEQSVFTRFYEVFGDDYDFANVVYLHPDTFANRDHFPVKNDVLGIGVPIFNSTALYGSVSALRGITRFPVDVYFDLADPGAQHELGHRWVIYLTAFPLLGGGSPHWPPSRVARVVQGALSAWRSQAVPGADAGHEKARGYLRPCNEMRLEPKYQSQESGGASHERTPCRDPIAL